MCVCVCSTVCTQFAVQCVHTLQYSVYSKNNKSFNFKAKLIGKIKNINKNGLSFVLASFHCTQVYMWHIYIHISMLHMSLYYAACSTRICDSAWHSFIVVIDYCCPSPFPQIPKLLLSLSNVQHRQIVVVVVAQTTQCVHSYF